MSLDEKSSIRHSRPTAARDLLHHVVPLLYYDGEVMEAAITALGMVNPAVFRYVETVHTASSLGICTVHTVSSLGICTVHIVSSLGICTVHTMSSLGMCTVHTVIVMDMYRTSTYVIVCILYRLCHHCGYTLYSTCPAVWNTYDVCSLML